MASPSLGALRELMGLVPALREAGVSEVTALGVTLKLGAAPIVIRPAPKTDRIEDEADAEDAREKRIRAGWHAHWSRMLRSSGAAVPAFPGVEKALAYLGES